MYRLIISNYEDKHKVIIYFSLRCSFIIRISFKHFDTETFLKHASLFINFLFVKIK